MLYRMIIRICSVLLLITLPFTAQAQERIVPDTKGQMQLSFSPVVKKVSPAVVNIYTKRVVERRSNPFMNDPFFSQLFRDNFGGRMRRQMESALGSGVILSADGLVVTNAHVAKDAEQITVALSDGREFDAKLVLMDAPSDLALLRFETKGEQLPYATLKPSEQLEVGDLVLAIGNPFGVGQTVTSGIVSALARSSLNINDFNFFIQTDAAINPGNSGGPLVALDGGVVGINSAIYSRDGGSLGIGFAIPANMVKAVISASQNGGKLVRPWTGFTGQTIASDMVESLGLKRAYGVLINSVRAGSPAEKAGMKAGDIVLTIDGKEVQGPEALKYRFAMLPVGSAVHLNILRAGQQQNLVMVTQLPPEDPPREETQVKGRNPLSGAVVANISPAVSEEIGGTVLDKGVVVMKAEEGNAARLGLGQGDIIVGVNNEKIDSVKELLGRLKSDQTRRWGIQIQRGGQLMNLMITI